MIRIALATLVTAAIPATPMAAVGAATPIAAVGAAMADSAAGWNAGDLDRFMRVYADDATYVTAKGLVRGKSAIAARYRPSFADGANRRGVLSFRMLGDRAIDAQHHLLFAQWTLAGATTTESGMTTLLFERRPEGWRIIADHSS